MTLHQICSPERKHIPGCLTQEEKTNLQKLGRKNMPCDLDQSDSLSDYEKDILEKAFLPVDLDIWLDTCTIDRVVKQWHMEFPTTRFLGAFPADHFSRKMWHTFANSSKNTALILNTQDNGMPGQHWIAIFIDTHTHQAFFFDPEGHPPSGSLRDAVKYISEKLPMEINRKKYQKLEGHCGVYSLYYLFAMAKGRWTGNMVPDDEILRFRKSLLRLPCSTSRLPM